MRSVDQCVEDQVHRPLGVQGTGQVEVELISREATGAIVHGAESFHKTPAL